QTWAPEPEMQREKAEPETHQELEDGAGKRGMIFKDNVTNSSFFQHAPGSLKNHEFMALNIDFAQANFLARPQDLVKGRGLDGNCVPVVLERFAGNACDSVVGRPDRA